MLATSKYYCLAKKYNAFILSCGYIVESLVEELYKKGRKVSWEPINFIYKKKPKTLEKLIYEDEVFEDNGLKVKEEYTMANVWSKILPKIHNTIKDQITQMHILWEKRNELIHRKDKNARDVEFEEIARKGQTALFEILKYSANKSNNFMVYFYKVDKLFETKINEIKEELGV